LKVAPTTESVEYELAILGARGRFFCCFGGLSGAYRFQGSSVCHQFRSANYHCAIGGARAAERRGRGGLQRLGWSVRAILSNAATIERGMFVDHAGTKE